MKLHSAFTLMEVMIALCIITTLSLFFIPPLQDMLQGTDDRILQTQLTRAIEIARRETNATHQPIALSINNQELMLFVNAKRNGIPEQTSDIVLQQSLLLKRGKLHLRLFPYYQHYLLFLPQELMANDNATFWYCGSSDTNARWAIVLSKSGRMRTITNEGKVITDARGKPLLC